MWHIGQKCWFVCAEPSFVRFGCHGHRARVKHFKSAGLLRDENKGCRFTKSYHDPYITSSPLISIRGQGSQVATPFGKNTAPGPKKMRDGSRFLVGICSIWANLFVYSLDLKERKRYSFERNSIQRSHSLGCYLGVPVYLCWVKLATFQVSWIETWVLSLKFVCEVNEWPSQIPHCHACSMIEQRDCKKSGKRARCWFFSFPLCS